MSKSTEKKVSVTFKLDELKLKGLKKVAEKQGRSVSNLLQKIIDDNWMDIMFKESEDFNAKHFLGDNKASLEDFIQAKNDDLCEANNVGNISFDQGFLNRFSEGVLAGDMEVYDEETEEPTGLHSTLQMIDLWYNLEKEQKK